MELNKIFLPFDNLNDIFVFIFPLFWALTFLGPGKQLNENMGLCMHCTLSSIMFPDLKRVSMELVLISTGREICMDVSMAFFFQKARTPTELPLLGQILCLIAVTFLSLAVAQRLLSCCQLCSEKQKKRSQTEQSMAILWTCYDGNALQL